MHRSHPFMPARSNVCSPRGLRRRDLVWGPLAALLPPRARAQERTALEKVRANGVLKVALYKDNLPYSDGVIGRMEGVDASLAAALARELQLAVAYMAFDAGENMGDDLRNMVWRGHYLGYGPADVMLHVPVDRHFMDENRQAFVFAPYTREHLVVLHNPQRLATVYNPEDLQGRSIAVEQGTGAASALLGYRGGLLRNQIALYKRGVDAAQAVLAGQAEAAWVTLAQAQSAVFAAGADRKAWAFSPLMLPGVPPNGWALGLAVKADHRDLAAALDTAMDALRRSGELLRIFQSHGISLGAP